MLKLVNTGIRGKLPVLFFEITNLVLFLYELLSQRGDSMKSVFSLILELFNLIFVLILELLLISSEPFDHVFPFLNNLDMFIHTISKSLLLFLVSLRLQSS